MIKRFLRFAKIAALLAVPFFAQSATAQNWDGFYIGGHFGYANGEAGWDYAAHTGTITDRFMFGHDVSPSIEGWIAGAHAGYNWQSGQMVYGVEANYTGADITGSVGSTTGNTFDDIYQTEIKSIAGLAARVGFASQNRLFYFKGGYAGTEIDNTVFDTIPGTQQGSDSQWHHGFQIGAGAEFATSYGMVWGVEYTYYNFADEQHNVVFMPNGGNITDDVSANLHTIALRLSYKF